MGDESSAHSELALMKKISELDERNICLQERLIVKQETINILRSLLETALERE